MQIASVPLAGTATMKGMASHMLREGFQYEFNANLTEGQIWSRIFAQSKRRGIIGLHFDECQHVFPDEPKKRRTVCNNFKSYMKRSRHPLIMILSGVNVLAGYVAEDEQLSHLLAAVHFDAIVPSSSEDLQEVYRIVFEYSESAELEFPSDYWTPDFSMRLAMSGANRWGLVIECVIEAILVAKAEGSRQLLPKHFCEAFTEKANLGEGHSPFSVDDYGHYFDADKTHQLLKMNATG